METKVEKSGIFPALAILAAVILLPAVTAGTPDAPGRTAEHPTVITLRAGMTGADIQRALNCLSDAGGQVVLPAGEFAISRPVVLRRDNQTLRGAGAATVLRLADNANCPVIIMGEPVNHPRRAIQHLLVSELAIDGNRRHQRRELWQQTSAGSEIHNNGITVQGVSDSTVKNVACAHCRSGGLVTTLGVRRLEVQNFEAFDNEFDGLACYLTVDSRFVNLNLHDNPGAGISLDLAFEHNSVIDAILTANDLGIFMRASRSNRFQNVSISRSRHFGVFIAQTNIETPHGARPVAHSECTDNLFMNLSATNCGGPAFHVNDSGCTNNVVVGTKQGVAFHDGSPPNPYRSF